jgi:hypothetical protein
MLLKINSPKLSNLDEMFIHRNAWFSICDFAYSSKEDSWTAPLNQSSPFDPGNIPKGSVVFATPWGINKFLEDIHPKINNPYILLTYCYGPVFDVAKYVNDAKILAWFGQANSNAITFEKFSLMPLGVYSLNQVFDQRQDNIALLNRLKGAPKSKLLYSNFFVHTGQHVSLGKRDQIYNQFKDQPFCTTITLTPTWRKPFQEYMTEMAQFKFVLSPEGDMHDTFRHWEALSVGCIPIVPHSPLDKIFEDLPVIIVDDWTTITEDFLNQKYAEMQGKQYNYDKIHMKYWSDLINQAKSK